jgi:hypothetical protein
MNTQFTEFDIAVEGAVPLLISLPQVRNLGVQFELTPDNAYLSCARIGMRKMVLRVAISIHLILDWIGFARCCVAHEPSSFQDSTKIRVSSHSMITLSTARLLLSKVFNKKKKLW